MLISHIIEAMTYKKVLAFDIGIKNLAFCILENDKIVLSLENSNILDAVEEVKCFMCPLNASYKAGDHVFCKRHIPGIYSILPELDTKKLPSIKVLKELIKKHNCENLGNSKEKCIESLSKRFTFHYEQPKQLNASKVSLEEIHDALRRFVQEKWTLFSTCTHVLLENQPAFKNPHMKSVQVLLFATLREKYIANHLMPEFYLVHAKKKVMNAKKGDEGYSERKTKSEDRLKELFNNSTVIGEKPYNDWQKSKKKSDMADALCMCVDF
jgi:cellobiose-specific phosphotransferase system component IIA